MLSEKRLQSLQAKSHSLARLVEEEERSPSCDPTVLRRLKKQKLELKQIIAGISEDSHSATS